MAARIKNYWTDAFQPFASFGFQGFSFLTAVFFSMMCNNLKTDNKTKQNNRSVSFCTRAP